MKSYSFLVIAGGLFLTLFHPRAQASTGAPVTRETPVVSSSRLPFFSDLAQGYDLPAPYGISVSYMGMQQGIQVDSIRFTGMRLGTLPLDNLVKTRAGKTEQKSHTETLRLDAWVLPFINVYGVAGRTKGRSVSDVSIRTPVFIGDAFPSVTAQNLQFRLDYKGTTLGAGATLVGGINDWFTTLDMNYTQTRFDVLDGHIDALTVTPRVGYRFTLPETGPFPAGSLNIWVGSMYQDVQQDFRGHLGRLSMPSPALQQWVNQLNKNGEARFEVNQRLKQPWNMLAGVRYDMTRSFSLTAEAGFGGRESFLLSGEYRF
ncbi:UNVERIFIED_ORG: hypothetical protein FHU01_4479 [Citrobacter freundii]